MIPDSNSVVGFTSNFIGGFFGTDSLVLVGILLFFLVILVMLWARVRAGTAVMIGAVFAVMLSFVAPEFGFLFWLAILASLVILINGLRKLWTGY